MKQHKTTNRVQAPNNLPPRMTPFVNRKQEIQAALSALREEKVSVVALTGIGGIGKTSLALEIAHRVLEEGEFSGGIVWLSGRDLQSIDDLTRKIAVVLGSPATELASRMRSQRCLVIFDGLDEIALPFELEVERFVETLPAPSKAIVTSRKEVTLSSPKVVIGLDVFTEKGARDLLQALGTKYDFDLSLADQERISEIVRILGYHPLALTIAAHLIQGKSTKALAELGKTIRVFEESDRDRESVALRLAAANVLQSEGNYSEALQFYKQALELAHQLGDSLSEANAWQSIGDVQQFRDERDAALESYRHALELFRQVGHRLGEANVLKSIGDVQQFRDERDAALESYSRALALFQQVGSVLGQANTSKAIGDVQQFRKEMDAALTSYSQALVLFQQVGSKLGEANTLQAIGDVQQFRKEMNAALTSYSQALVLFQQVGSKLGEANTLQAIGDLQRFHGEYDVALESYSQALVLFQQVGDRLGEANTLQAIGNVRQFRKELDGALTSYSEALKLFQQVGSKLGEANALQAVGDIQSFMRMPFEAIKNYQQALDLYRLVGARLGEANVLQSLGAIQLQLGALDDAMVSYEIALNSYRAIGDQLGESNTLSSLASVLADKGDSQRALEFYLTALELKQGVGDRRGEANTLVGMGQVLTRDNPDDALDYYQRALSIYEQIGDRYSSARVLYNLGVLYFDKGELEKANKILAQAKEEFAFFGLHEQENIVSNARADADYELGKKYVDEGRWYAALDLFYESLAVRRQGDNFSARADVIYQIARTHHLLGNLDKARIHYRDALRLYEHAENLQGLAACRTALGRLMIQMGFVGDAVTELDSAKKIYRQLGDEGRIAEVEQVLSVANHIQERQHA